MSVSSLSPTVAGLAPSGAVSAETSTVEVGVRPQVDPRGQRFAAGITTSVFALALVTAPSTFSLVLLVAQLASFVVGTFVGPARTPYAWLFRTFVRPRLGAPRELEDAAPPRFAQGVGLLFAVVAVTGYAAGLPLLGAVAAGMALAAAFLNAAFNFCLGCEMYLLFKRTSVKAALVLLSDSATH